MAVIRLAIDKKYVARHLDSFNEAGDLIAGRGDALLEYACNDDVDSVNFTNKQCDTLARLLESGLSLELAQDGSLKLI